MVSRDAAPDVRGRLRRGAVEPLHGRLLASVAVLPSDRSDLHLDQSFLEALGGNSIVGSSSFGGRSGQSTANGSRDHERDVVRVGPSRSSGCAGVFGVGSSAMRFSGSRNQPAWRGHRTDSAQRTSIESVMSDSKGPGVEPGPRLPQPIGRRGVPKPSPGWQGIAAPPQVPPTSPNSCSRGPSRPMREISSASRGYG